MARRPMSEAHRSNMTAAVRAAMRRPEVRERISVATKAAKAALSEQGARELRAAWNLATPAVRKRFLSAVLAPVCHIGECGDG
jgi:phage baseplate assembly protein W